MIIKSLRAGGRFREVEVTDGNAKIVSGFLDENEVNELAKQLADVMYDIGPSENYDCAKWIKGIFEKAGIELPSSCRDTNE